MTTSAKSLLCSAFLLLCMLIASFSRAEADCGGFAGSCQNFAIDGSGIWSSDCKTGTSGSAFSSHSQINTNQFLGNNNGVLVEGAGYVDSCQDLGLFTLPTGGVELKANCRDGRGTLQLALFDVNTRIDNVNGILTWNHCRRRSLLEVSTESTFEHTEASEKLQIDAGILHRKTLL